MSRPARTPHLRRPGWFAQWWRDDRGSVAAEVTLLTPLLIMLLVLVAVVVHRGVAARLYLDDAAHQAARAASLQRSVPEATAAADSTARAALSPAVVACRAPQISTDTGGLVPGGTITVTLTCTLDWRDGLIAGIPGHTVLSATATEPVDTWRSPTRTPIPGGAS